MRYVLTESWLTDAVSDQYLAIPKYNFVRMDRCATTGKRRGGGIIVHIKDNINAVMVPELSISDARVELIMLRLSLNYTRPIYIMCVYRPPDQNALEFINIMDGFINSMYEKPFFELNIIGDINLNLMKPRDTNVRKYKSFMMRHGLTNLISTPTHYNTTLTEGSIIDHFLTTDPCLYSQHGTSPTIVSDHYIISGARKKIKIKTGKIKMLVRKYKGLDETKLINDLSNADWSPVMETEDPSIAWDNLVEIFTNILDHHAPYKNMHFDENIPVWMTHELLAEIKVRNSLTKKADRTKNNIDIRLAKMKRNYITGFKRNLKRNYFKQAIENVKDDPIKLWRILRAL